MITNISAQILELLKMPGATLKELAELVAKDRSLTKRVLSLVNKSYCKTPEGVSELLKALQYIGLDTLIQLALTLNIK